MHPVLPLTPAHLPHCLSFRYFNLSCSLHQALCCGCPSPMHTDTTHHTPHSTHNTLHTTHLTQHTTRAWPQLSEFSSFNTFPGKPPHTPSFLCWWRLPVNHSIGNIVAETELFPYISTFLLQNLRVLAGHAADQNKDYFPAFFTSSGMYNSNVTADATGAQSISSWQVPFQYIPTSFHCRCWRLTAWGYMPGARWKCLVVNEARYSLQAIKGWNRNINTPTSSPCGWHYSKECSTQSPGVLIGMKPPWSTVLTSAKTGSSFPSHLPTTLPTFWDYLPNKLLTLWTWPQGWLASRETQPKTQYSLAHKIFPDLLKLNGFN